MKILFIALIMLLPACSKKPVYIPPLPDIQPLERVDVFYDSCVSVGDNIANNCNIVGLEFMYDFSLTSEHQDATNGEAFGPESKGMLVCFTPTSFAKLQGYQDALIYFDQIIRMKGDEVLGKLKWKIGRKFTQEEFDMIEKTWRDFNKEVE